MVCIGSIIFDIKIFNDKKNKSIFVLRVKCILLIKIAFNFFNLFSIRGPPFIN